AGTQLVDGRDQPVRLLGVNRSGTEYACIQGWGFFDGPSDAASLQAIAAWHTTAVRIPLNEDCWLAINGAPAAYAGAAYQQAIAGYIATVQAAGLVPILELHWTGAGSAPATGQQPMPNRDHSVTFWQQVATAYRGNPGVVFELFNEPYPDGNQDTPAAWDCWQHGTTASNRAACPGSGYTYQAAGMQELVDAVRATGAPNVILLGGVQYANALSGWLAHRPSDPANNLAAAWHVYNFNVCNTTACYDATAGPVAAAVPLVTTELGENDCAHGFIDVLLPWLDGHGAGYLAWTWDTWGGCGPVLITRYDGTPTTYGQGFRDHLAAIAGGGGTPPPTPSPGATANLLLTSTPGGSAHAALAGPYAVGTPVTLTATPASGYVFTGWLVDGRFAGWANPFTLTMNANHTVQAAFAAPAAVTDIAGNPYASAISQLTARNIIQGYQPAACQAEQLAAPWFGPRDPTLRAQMAALIVRAMTTVQAPGWPGPASGAFPDQCNPPGPYDPHKQCIDPELWSDVLMLNAHQVAQGYSDPAACAPEHASAPCFQPFGTVLYVQAVSFVSRALVNAGYWQQQGGGASLFGGALAGTGNEDDVATYLHYAGSIPTPTASGVTLGNQRSGWVQPATRDWFSALLWAALDSQFGH
ncbi:MAG: cellulase family glycosylhydrolase, partial [Thermomicrobiales bacterium]